MFSGAHRVLLMRTKFDNSNMMAFVISKFTAKYRNPLMLFNRNYFDHLSPNLVRGMDYLRDPRLNKGTAFTVEERQTLGIHGLLPPRHKTQDEQLFVVSLSYDNLKSSFDKYLFLAELQDRNETLFYRLLCSDVEKFMPIVYTPTVGLACQKFGLVFKRPRGLFITIKDKGNIIHILRHWPERDIRAICFTDGERILGLGDLGAHGMGIPVGKLSLYTALAGVKPHQCLPITLDVGTDNKALLEDPLYIGLRMKRVRGKEYEDFIDEFMAACVARYGPATLLQFEDFALQNASPLLDKYITRYCTFNDDIQGTASVAVAGLIASIRITKKKMSDNIYMFLGAGSAANGIGNLIVAAMAGEGVDVAKAREKIFMFDIDGLVTSKRKGGVPSHAKNFGKDLPPETNFEKCVATIKPTTLIGCSTVGGAFTKTILQQMAKNCERPVIFALSNPTSKAECTAQDCYDQTEGRCVYASGSPFPPVKYGGKTYYTGQGNNSYIFPGLALGVLATGALHIPDSMFLMAAQTVAEVVSEKDLEVGRIYPPLKELRSVSLAIAVKCGNMAYDAGLASAYPKPNDMIGYIKSHIFKEEYPSCLPKIWKWCPDEVMPKLPKNTG